LWGFFQQKTAPFFLGQFRINIVIVFLYIYILSKERHSVEKLKLKHKIIRERPQLEQVLKKEKKKRLRMYI
jgi:membrane-bound acyltransferase YfiQ involved in biofilm formation